MPILVNFERPLDGKVFRRYLEFILWYILWSIGILVYFTTLVCCTKKNLATLVWRFSNNENVPFQRLTIYLALLLGAVLKPKFL
jgi:hypothetical protein